MGDLMRRFRFAPLLDADTGGGGGAGDGGQSAGSGDGSQGTDPKAGGKITFTPEQQAAIDAIIAERVSRANKAAGKSALEARAKELGYDSIEAMETALQAHKEATDKQKTDLQKAQEAKAAAEAKAKAAEANAKTALIRAAFAEQAIAQNLASAEDAFRLADLSKVTVADDGTVEGVKEAVEDLAKAKPYLVKQGAGSAGGTGGNPPRGGAGQTDDGAQKAVELARQRNQVSQGAYNPWATGSAGPDQAAQIAQAVAAAVAQVLKQ